MADVERRGILGKASVGTRIPSPTPAQRKAVYRVVSAVLLVLSLHKVVTADEAATYLSALALALGILPAELAAQNTPTD